MTMRVRLHPLSNYRTPPQIPSILSSISQPHPCSRTRIPRHRAGPPRLWLHRVPSTYNYTFDNLAETIDEFLEKIPKPPSKYSIYIFDYGAPTGLRIAMKHPERIQSIISQNGNAYVEGLGAFWDPIKVLWANNSAENCDALRPFLEINVTKSQYEDGTKDPSTIVPESYSLDQALLDRLGNKDIQLDLIHDYQSNVIMYPKWQEYFRKSQVPLLAAWGKNEGICQR